MSKAAVDMFTQCLALGKTHPMFSYTKHMVLNTYNGDNKQ